MKKIDIIETCFDCSHRCYDPDIGCSLLGIPTNEDNIPEDCPLPGTEDSRVACVMSNAINKSNTNIEKLRAALATPKRWWCCMADFPNHEPDCENYKG